MSDRVKQTKFKLAKLTLKLFLLKDAFNKSLSNPSSTRQAHCLKVFENTFS